jgi:hypothetical protein
VHRIFPVVRLLPAAHAQAGVVGCDVADIAVVKKVVQLSIPKKTGSDDFIKGRVLYPSQSELKILALDAWFSPQGF